MEDFCVEVEEGPQGAIYHVRRSDEFVSSPSCM